VKDAQGDPVMGRIRWRRFAAVVLPAALAAGALMTGMANGAVPAQFAVSGQTFKVKAERLVGDGFVQYGGFASENGANKANPFDSKNHAVATSAIAVADLYKLCQSVKVPNLPVSLVIHAGEAPGKPAHATNLMIDMTDLSGDATFTDIRIGQDAGTLNGSAGPNGTGGMFGQKASHVEIENLQQTSWSTTAGTFALTGLHLYVSTGFKGETPEQCF
jgi:hypothetical protein